MRKNLFVKTHSLYIALFLFAATAPRRPCPGPWIRRPGRGGSSPGAPSIAVRRAFDVITFPIG